MNHKKFMDIERIKENIIGGFEVGNHIVIQEKIDGANAAIRYDSETNTVVAQSRKNILNISNNLRGFYEWTQTLNVDKVREVLGDNLILFGEWLMPHSVKYPNDKYNHAYFYDIFETAVRKIQPREKSCETCKYFHESTQWCSRYNDTTYSTNCTRYKNKEGD